MRLKPFRPSFASVPAILSFALPAFLLAGTLSAQRVAARTRPSEAPEVRIVGAPTAWVVPFTEGNTAEGKLYFGATIENTSARVVVAGLSFQAYLPDGTRYNGCYELAGSGPGVSTEVPPRGRAFLVCQRSIVPLAKAVGVQVTSRLWDVRTVATRPVPVAVIDSGLQPGDAALGERRYTAYALLRSRVSQDVGVHVLFRFLAEDGTQVATCESDAVRVEPEVAVRVTCGSADVLLPDGTPRPTGLRADLRASGF